MEKIGSINYEWVGPRYVRSTSRGELQEDETGLFLDEVEARIKDEPYFVWEVDVTELTGMDAAARRVCADRLRRLPDRAIAVVGGKFAQMILVKLVLTAVSMLDRRQRHNQMSFFPDSEAASAWLAEYGRHYENEVMKKG